MIPITPVMPEFDLGYDPMPDLEQRLAALQEEGHRVVPVRYLGGIAWVILRFDDVSAIFLDDDQVPAAAAYERSAMPAQGRTLLAMRGQQHRVNRALVAGVLQPAAVRRHVETLLVPIANRLIDQLTTPGPVDIVSAFTKRYPFNVISGLLGIPLDAEEQLLEWVNLLFLYPTEPERAVRARTEISAFLQPLVDERRSAPGPDIISQLVKAEVDGERLSDEEILSFVRLIYPAGADTTYLLLGSLIRDVIADRSLYERVLGDKSQRELIIEETLRLRSPVALQVRYTEAQLTIAGIEIPADSWLLYGISPANRDAAQFENPHQTMLGRKNNNTFLTFGRGPHFCLGRHLAREEIKVSLDLLLDRLPGLRLAEEVPPCATGSVLRGVRSLNVMFDRVLPAPQPASA